MKTIETPFYGRLVCVDAADVHERLRSPPHFARAMVLSALFRAMDGKERIRTGDGSPAWAGCDSLRSREDWEVPYTGTASRVWLLPQERLEGVSDGWAAAPFALRYMLEANYLPCQGARDFRFHAHSTIRATAVGQWHNVLRAKSQSVRRTASFVDFNQPEARVFIPAGAQKRYLRRPVWWDSELWAAPGLLLEGPPFMDYCTSRRWFAATMRAHGSA